MARRHRLGGTLAVAILLAAIGLNLFDAADPADRSAYLAFSGLWLVATVGLDWLVGRVRLFNGRLWPRLALAALIGYIGYAEYVTNASLSALAQYYDSMDAGEVAAADWLDTTDLPLHDGIAAIRRFSPTGSAAWPPAMPTAPWRPSAAPGSSRRSRPRRHRRPVGPGGVGQRQPSRLTDSGHRHHLADGIAYVLSYGSGQTTADLLYLNESKATIAYSVAAATAASPSPTP
jgi:hypothetical protein